MIWPERMRVSLILNVTSCDLKLYICFTSFKLVKLPASNSNGVFRESVIDVFVSYMTGERELVLKLTNRSRHTQSKQRAGAACRNACFDVNIDTRRHVSENSH